MVLCILLNCFHPLLTPYSNPSVLSWECIPSTILIISLYLKHENNLVRIRINIFSIRFLICFHLSVSPPHPHELLYRNFLLLFPIFKIFFLSSVCKGDLDFHFLLNWIAVNLSYKLLLFCSFRQPGSRC